MAMAMATTTRARLGAAAAAAVSASLSSPSGSMCAREATTSVGVRTAASGASTVRARSWTTKTDDPEGRWSARATTTTEGMPTRASWSTTALTTGRGERGSNGGGGGGPGSVIDAKELRSVARLANVSVATTRRGEEAMLRDVDGILRFVKRLDAVDTDGVKPMWTTREAEEEGGEGLRMRFDASAPGERELASLERGRLMAEAKYANGDRYVAPRGGVSEE